MNEEGPEPAVVVTRAARGAKAALGPTAWVVFEELTLGDLPLEILAIEKDVM